MRVDASDFRTTETDGQGRITLGLAAAYQDAAENATQRTADWKDASTDAWHALDE